MTISKDQIEHQIITLSQSIVPHTEQPRNYIIQLFSFLHFNMTAKQPFVKLENDRLTTFCHFDIVAK